ncbi:MAG: glycosyltransferase [Gammaproteobacteria bacterium]
MKILHIETGMNLYGGGRQVVWILRGLAERGVENVLLCPAGSEIATAHFPAGVEVVYVPMGGDLDLSFIPKAMAQIRQHRPDVIHLHSRRGADWLGGVAARLCRTPAVLSRRVTNPERRLAVPLKYRLFRRVITISDAIRRTLIDAGVDPATIRVVRSAVAEPDSDSGWSRERFREEFSLDPDACVIGMAAQFIARKGYEVLLEALPDVLAAQPSVRVLLFGRGPLEEVIARRIADTGLGGQLVLAGYRSDLDQLIGCLDILVHPALDEGLGVVVLEASAAGVPVVSTRAGGIPEAVRDEETGLLVSPGDASALADALQRLTGDEGLRRRLGEAGEALMRRDFSVAAMVDGNLEVYREILEGENG